MADLWNHDEPITKLDAGINIPTWIDQNITPSDVAAICQGGCASGAYMPAVTYHQAIETMSNHGDDVLQFIEDCDCGELPHPGDNQSWSGMATFYLSYAVELWASSVEEALETLLDAKEEKTAAA
jgi:hypothetical protein